MASFQLSGLASTNFSHLFELTEQQLQELGIRRVTADSSPGFPCRVSLADAAVGEELLLLPFEHQPELTPYRASGPIFVRAGAQPPALRPDELPPYVTRRLISVRAYNAAHIMVDASVCAGDAVAAEIERQFANAQVAYLHLHNAKQGCYSCRVDRVTRS